MTKEKFTNVAIETVGWYGMAAVFGAYALTTLSYIAPGGMTANLLNSTGAIGIVVVTVKHRAWPSAVLNILWTIIGLVAIVKLLM
jgi:hypothetical protein